MPYLRTGDNLALAPGMPGKGGTQRGQASVNERTEMLNARGLVDVAIGTRVTDPTDTETAIPDNARQEPTHR